MKVILLLATIVTLQNQYDKIWGKIIDIDYNLTQLTFIDENKRVKDYKVSKEVRCFVASVETKPPLTELKKSENIILIEVAKQGNICCIVIDKNNTIKYIIITKAKEFE